jgi:uncharacterized protein
MKLSLSQIDDDLQTVGQVLEEDFLKEVLTGRHSTDLSVQGAHHVTLHVQRSGLDILLHSQFSLQLQTDCALCLRTFELKVPVRFSLTLKPGPQESREIPEELELTREDLEDSHYTGDTIDLAEILREQIILALPMYPKCSEACKGLCPGCGVDRNKESCRCDEGNVDPRWAKLKVLKASTEE